MTSSIRGRAGFVACAILVTAAVFTSGGCADTTAGATVHTAANPAAHFGQYRTFSFAGAEAAPAGYAIAKRSVEVDGRLKALVQDALSSRGYVADSRGHADLVIVFAAGERTIPTHQDSEITADWEPSDETGHATEGKLIVDVFAGKTHVWHGSSRETVNPDHVDEPRLQAYVRELFASFPAAGASPRP